MSELAKGAFHAHSLTANRQSLAPKGQTLLELIVALGVILAGIIGSTTLILAATTAGRRSIDIVIGQNLAREGLEIVRSIRDSNWLDPNYPETKTCPPFPPPETWDRDLIGNDLVTCVKNDPTAAPIVTPDGYVNGSAFLDYTADSFGQDPTKIGLRGDRYVQPLAAGDVNVNYFRLLTFYRICWDTSTPPVEQIAVNSSDACLGFGLNFSQVGLKVVSDVRWPTTGPTAKKVVLEDRLYNWRP